MISSKQFFSCDMRINALLQEAITIQQQIYNKENLYWNKVADNGCMCQLNRE